MDFFLLHLSMQFVFAQEKTVTGVVSDVAGPTPGVNFVMEPIDQFKLILTEVYTLPKLVNVFIHWYERGFSHRWCSKHCECKLRLLKP
jgi:hypothetical protein